MSGLNREKVSLDSFGKTKKMSIDSYDHNEQHSVESLSGISHIPNIQPNNATFIDDYQ